MYTEVRPWSAWRQVLTSHSKVILGNYLILCVIHVIVNILKTVTCCSHMTESLWQNKEEHLDVEIRWKDIKEYLDVDIRREDDVARTRQGQISHMPSDDSCMRWVWNALSSWFTCERWTFVMNSSVHITTSWTTVNLTATMSRTWRSVHITSHLKKLQYWGYIYCRVDWQRQLSQPWYTDDAESWQCELTDQEMALARPRTGTCLTCLWHVPRFIYITLTQRQQITKAHLTVVAAEVVCLVESTGNERVVGCRLWTNCVTETGVEDSGGGRQWGWKTVGVEDSEGGRQWGWKTVGVEDSEGGRQWGWKTVEVEDSGGMTWRGIHPTREAVTVVCQVSLLLRVGHLK